MLTAIGMVFTHKTRKGKKAKQARRLTKNTDVSDGRQWKTCKMCKNRRSKAMLEGSCLYFPGCDYSNYFGGELGQP